LEILEGLKLCKGSPLSILGESGDPISIHSLRVGINVFVGPSSSEPK
jgi:hypothetical protein